MYSKLSLAFLAALTVVAQAEVAPSASGHGHDHHHHGSHHHHPSGIFPSGQPYKPSGGPAPFPTGGALPTGAGPTGGAGGANGPGGAEPTGDTTLTYTIGTGDHTTVVTTTIHHANTHTDYVYGQQTGAPEGSTNDNSPAGQNDENSPAGGNDQGGDVTRTVHITSTSTNYISAAAGGNTAAPEKIAENNSPAQGAAGAGNSAGCAVQQTVTVTGAEVTVTVTASPAAASGPAAAEPENGAAPAAQSSAPASANPPYPTGPASYTSSKCKSTGFITKPSSGFNPKPTGYNPLPTGSGWLQPKIESAKAYKN